jgi:hypothetical protein
MLSKLKKSGPHKEGSPGFKKMRQVQFAIRAKRGWKGGVKEAEQVDEKVEIFHRKGWGGDMERYDKNVNNPAAVASRKAAADAAKKLRSSGQLSGAKSLGGPYVPTDDRGGAIDASGTKRLGFKKGSGMAEAKPEQQRMFGASMEELLKKYRRDVERFRSSGELNDRLYSALYDYFVNGDEMPYGVAKARTGDPMQWISDRLAQHLGMNEGDLDEVSRGEYIKQQDTKAERSGKKKFKAFGQEFSTDEVKENDAMMSDADRGEYDYEGDMAKDQLRTIEAAAEELKSILSDEENLPEWVQKKITLAAEYVDTARDYMLAKHDERAEQPLGEKAVSQAQQQAAGIALAAKKAGKTPPGKGAAAAMAKMSKKELEKFAGTKHEGLPKKKKTKEEVEETTVAGSVATAPANTSKKKKGGVQFGKGIYENQLRESFDNRLKAVLNEGVSFSVNVDANGAKTLNVNATDEDAERLAQILQLAGMPQAETHQEVCPACGSEPCGCEAVSEGDYGNSPETVTSSSDMMVNGLSGGLNGPKQQSNPNNAGDNPLAMPRLGQHSSPNLNLGIQKDEKEINEEVERGLRELYKRYKP